MAKSMTARSPLAARSNDMASASSETIALKEVPFVTQLDLRGEASDKGFTAGASKALGFSLPANANRVREKGDIAALWLSPDEWLLITGEEDTSRLASTFKVMLSDKHFALTDVSDNRTMLELSGPDCWSVLSKLGTLDYHSRAWKRADCAQTLLGSAQVIIWMKKDGKSPVFNILVRNSFADYLALLLMDAMQEFQTSA